MGLIWKQKPLPTLAEKKAAEVNAACEAAIHAGVDVALSGGAEHFALTPNDQTNIDSMFTAITLGATQYPYHADGSQCKMYVAADIMTLYVAYKSFVTYQTTYNNFLKIWINRETDKNALAGITYGSTLPEDLLTQIAEETGGRYYRATSENNLKEIFNEIDNLEKTKIEVISFEHRSEEYKTILWLALGLFLLELAGKLSIFKTLP